MRFSKWHALGNSYLLLERAERGAPLAAPDARRLCDPGIGIGADGVLELVSVSDGEAEIVIWNPDGSTAELSGNGTRIAAAWLLERTGGDEARIATGSRVVRACRRGDRIETEVGRVEVGEPESIDVTGEVVDLVPVLVGNPHAVLLREPTRDELLRLGPLLERHPRFPDRTNVQLVRFDGPHAAAAVVWERGAGETAASGTSAVAVTAVGIAAGALVSPVTVRTPGGELIVELDEAGNARVTGPAERICEGELAPAILS